MDYYREYGTLKRRKFYHIFQKFWNINAPYRSVFLGDYCKICIYEAVLRRILAVTRSSAIAEGLRDTLVSRNPATTKHSFKLIAIDK